jgi:hypothetical protein
MLLLLLACGEDDNEAPPPVVPAPLDSADPQDSAEPQDSEAPDTGDLQDAGDPPNPVLSWTCPSTELVVAEAGDSLVVELGARVELDGSGSTGAETWAWDLTEGEATLEGAETGTVAFTPDAEGLYELRLQVSSGGDSAKDKVLVRVGGESAPPTARVAEPSAITLGEELALDGSTSDGSSYLWFLVEAPEGSSIASTDLGQRDASTLRFSPDVPGTWELRLEVRRGDETAITWVRAQVGSEPLAPGYHALGPLTFSATGLEGWSEEVDVKWSSEGSLVDDQDLDRLHPCLSFLPRRTGAYPFKVVFSDPDTGEVLQRHYPEYVVVDGPTVFEPTQLSELDGVRVGLLGDRLTLQASLDDGEPVLIRDLPLDGGAWRELYVPSGRTGNLHVPLEFDDGFALLVDDSELGVLGVREGEAVLLTQLEDWRSYEALEVLTDLEGGQELLHERTIYGGELAALETRAWFPDSDFDLESASTADPDGDGVSDLWIQHALSWDYSSTCSSGDHDLVWLQGPIEGGRGRCGRPRSGRSPRALRPQLGLVERRAGPSALTPPRAASTSTQSR